MGPLEEHAQAFWAEKVALVTLRHSISTNEFAKELLAWVAENTAVSEDTLPGKRRILRAMSPYLEGLHKDPFVVEPVKFANHCITGLAGALLKYNAYVLKAESAFPRTNMSTLA